MLDVLISIAAFVFALGLLVTIHEFGHYLVMRLTGVKVLKFSIGFGRSIISRRWGRDQTEYVIAILPLGGYVKPLDEHEGDVAEQDLPRAYNRQSLSKRSAIAFAGPAFNLAFAVLAYWLVFMVGIPGLKPVVGHVSPHSPVAVAGVQQGDEIIAVNGTRTPTWKTTVVSLLDGVMGGDDIRLKIKPPQQKTATQAQTKDLTVHVTDSEALTRPGALLPGLGLSPWLSATISRVVKNSPAARSGLKAGDTVLKTDGSPINSWMQWVSYVRAHPNTQVTIVVMRQGKKVNLSLHIGAQQLDGKTIGHVGAARKATPTKAKHQFAFEQYGPFSAIGQALTRTGEMSWLTLKMFWGMVTGNASLKNLSGPVGIAQYAGHAVSGGFVSFATFLALISISLGILNLLPVPVLDGGHLLYYAIEWMKGSPLSQRAELIGQQIGLTLLLALVGFSVFNDITRLVG